LTFAVIKILRRICSVFLMGAAVVQANLPERPHPEGIQYRATDNKENQGRIHG
jgi:Na+-transporting methylmalonyl-CoA/oxaloacetate decarboxylase gamma subunit